MNGLIPFRSSQVLDANQNNLCALVCRRLDQYREVSSPAGSRKWLVVIYAGRQVQLARTPAGSVKRPRGRLQTEPVQLNSVQLWTGDARRRATCPVDAFPMRVSMLIVYSSKTQLVGFCDSISSDPSESRLFSFPPKPQINLRFHFSVHKRDEKSLRHAGIKKGKKDPRCCTLWPRVFFQ